MELSQEQYDEIIKKLKVLSFQKQEAKDFLEGGLTSRNFTSFRNTYVINAQDSLDDSYPMYVHFNIISEMVKIVSVKVSFWILPFRAYSTTVPSGGGHTTASGGGHTTASGGGHTTASGGGSTSGSGGGQTSSAASADTYACLLLAGTSVTNVGSENASGLLPTPSTGVVTKGNHTHTVSNHTHSTPNHTHAVANHTHTVSNHTHAVANHTHSLTFGIYEEDNSPTIKFYISENKGISYNDTFFGGYTEDTSNVEITSLLEGSGSKLLKFTSSARGRLSVQIEVKLDIKAR